MQAHIERKTVGNHVDSRCLMCGDTHRMIDRTEIADQAGHDKYKRSQFTWFANQHKSCAEKYARTEPRYKCLDCGRVIEKPFVRSSSDESLCYICAGETVAAREARAGIGQIQPDNFQAQMML